MRYFSIGNKLYNGFDQNEIATSKGLSKLGIENARVFLTREVLLDIVKLKGKEKLDRGVEVTATDIKSVLKKQQLDIQPRDAVFIHTGWGSLWKVDNDLYRIGELGIGISAAEFFIEKKLHSSVPTTGRSKSDQVQITKFNSPCINFSFH